MLPLVFPGLVAASIFSFSLTLGDYITVELVGKSVLLGNTIDAYAGGTANDQPLAAALATIPIVIMGVYLLRRASARRIRGPLMERQARAHPD